MAVRDFDNVLLDSLIDKNGVRGGVGNKLDQGILNEGEGSVQLTSSLS
jgi:hypothetical protein